MKHKYPLITIRWADHFFHSEDLDLEEIIKKAKEPIVGEYTGYKVHESKQIVVLASNIWEETPTEGISPTMYIMKKAIVFRSDKEKKDGMV